MEWGPAEIVAAGSATIAFVAVVVTGVQIFVSANQADNQREHTEELQRQQLVHQRRLAHEARAAEAYAGAYGAADLMEWDYFYKAIIVSVGTGNRELRQEYARRLRAAINEFTETRFYAWSDGMVSACGRVIAAGESLEKQANASAGLIESFDHSSNNVDDIEAIRRVEKKYREVWQEYTDAVEEYRKAARINS